MPGISTTFMAIDRMSPVLQSITDSMTIMLQTLRITQDALERTLNIPPLPIPPAPVPPAPVPPAPIPPAPIPPAPVPPAPVPPAPIPPAPVPPPPVPPPLPNWNASNNIEIFTNTGVDRFTSEVDAANVAMQRLSSSQSAITTKINSMQGLPPEMVNDITGIDSRMQQLGQRVEELNHIPVELRTEQTNNEIETLRNRIQQASQVQEDLNKAIENMDIQAANAAYQRLNGMVGETEQQIRNNSAAQQGFSTEVNKSSGMAEKLKGLLVGVGAAIGVKTIMNFSNDYKVACNSLQTQTGMTIDEINVMSESMKNIYANNFGENFEDIANSMATVSTLTGQMGEELEATTQNAILMRDTFGFEVNESIRAVDMMVKQFGISSETAYNLIAQGAQEGLNKNDDLLDTINEYSVQFQSLGMNADQMFNMLSNGVNSGTFSVDKLGDSIKEFGIRAVDCSKTSIEGFEMLGLNAGDMIGRFKAGGDIANQAFTTVTQALGNMKNPIDQNTAAVALFGTMAEDLGVKGILSMQNMNGAISSTKNTLEEINTVRYDDLGSMLATIGRSISVEILEPAGKIANTFLYALEQAEPAISWFSNTVLPTICDRIIFLTNTAMQFVTLIQENWGSIEPIIWGIVGAFVAYKAITLAHKMVTTITTLAQNKLNLALLKSPVTWIALAIGVLIAIIYKWVQSVGGIKIAWMICVDKVLTVWDMLCLGCQWLVMQIVNGWDSMMIGIEKAKVGILNIIGNLKVKGLLILQGFVNGAIDLINDLIRAVNSTGLLTLTVLKQVTFGTTAEIEERELQAERKRNLDTFIEDKSAAKKAREDNWENAKTKADEKQNERADEIITEQEKAKKKLEEKEEEKAEERKPPGVQENNSEIGNSAQSYVTPQLDSIDKNTKDIKNSLDINSENLKYIRDIAEQEVVNRFTTAEIKVDMANYNNIHSNMDIDGFSEKLRLSIEKEMNVAAEGVH